MNELSRINSGVIRLSARDRQVLAAVNLRADRPLKEVAQLAKCQVHAARYSLHKLISEGLIEKRWMIDSYRLGFSRCVIFISTRLLDRATKERFAKFLVASPQTAYVAETAGGFDYLVSIFIRKIGDVLDFQQQISQRFGDIVAFKSVSLRNCMSFFSRCYLGNKSTREVISFQAVDKPEVLDEIDLRILKLLTIITNQTHREIARKLDMPPTTFEYRLEQLRRRKIVRGTIYNVNSNLYGATSFTLLFYARGLPANLRENLYQYGYSSPYTVHFLDGVGEWDFDFDVEVEDYRQLQSIKDDLSEKFKESVREIRVLTALNILKNRFLPQSL